MIVYINGHSLAYQVQSVCALFLEGEKITIMRDAHPCPQTEYIYTQQIQNSTSVSLFVKVVYKNKTLEKNDTIDGQAIDEKSLIQTQLCIMLYHILSEIVGKKPKWGIITGIRPVKKIHMWQEQGYGDEQIVNKLKEQLVSDEKIKLAMRTQKNECPILQGNTPDSYSLYISIPFCPTRCGYCSFVSHAIDRTMKLVPEYVEYLCKELTETANYAKKLGLKLRSIYFGGGTPTTLTCEQLEQILCVIQTHFDVDNIEEYTVEAGRPDTITYEKLKVLKNYNVTRISINPQTFSDEVLKEIGRAHTSEQTIQAYHMAREIGFDAINMDIIAGLPSDTLTNFKHTVNTLIALDPENITLHTLSVKRSSDYYTEKTGFLGDAQNEVEQMLSYAYQQFSQNAYEPYYLYKQKNMLSNLENTGFSKKQKECYYNVYIMSEVHTILAVGSGGVTKLKNPITGDIERIFNYKFPYEYISGFQSILKNKERVTLFYEANN